MIASIASMFATANNYFRNGENFSSRPLFLGLDVTILVKTVVFLFCSGIILWCLWDLWRGNDDDDDSDFLDMLKDLTTQRYTLYSSCVDHVKELDDLPENTVHKVSCGSRRQRKPRRRQPPDSYLDSSPDYSPATKCDSEYDNEYDFFYDRANELETKRKPLFPSKRHVELPSDCKQCGSMHLCNNDGDRCVNIRVDTPESRNDTATSSETEHSFWPLNIMGSSDSISSFTSWSSFSSTSNPSTLVSEMSETVHATPVVSKDEPSSTNKGPAGRSELNNPLSVKMQGRHNLEHSIRRKVIRRLWRRAILLVRVIGMLLPERLKQATKRIPEILLIVEEENHKPMVCDKVTDPNQHDNAKTTFKKDNTTLISQVAINGQKDLKREKMETRTSSKPLGLKLCPGLVKTPRPQCFVHLFAYPKPRSFLIRMIGEETTDFLEMTLKQNRLHHLLGVPTLYSDSLEKTAAEEVTPQPVQLDFHGEETPFLPQEIRNRLECHVKHKVIKKQWALPKLALKYIKAFRSEGAKYQRYKSMDNRNLIIDSNAETISQPLITCQQLQDEIGPITVTSLETEGGESLSAASSQSDYSTEESVCSSVLVIDTSTQPDALEVSKTYPRTKFEIELKSKCLEIRLSMPQGRVPPKRLVKKLVGPGMRIPIPRVKNILFMRKVSIKLLEMNLKQKHLANALRAPTIFSKSVELITPKETPQPKEVSEVEFEFNCSKALISKEMRDKLEFHIKRKKIQHLWGLQESLNALIPKAPKMDPSRVFPKPKYDVEVVTSDMPFLIDEQKEALECNVRKKKTQKNWGYPKLIMDSLKAEVPEAKNLDKRHPPAASKDVPVEPMSSTSSQN
ncbi:uncharacterized protein LOC118359177 [Oncorhynchus keta]|uniref:uncharacterized protein LOC118359177 n=1 Tax=Oncorhynchus keta TaxID=8018 RepID=UPI0015FD449F|nr:uncharacterized protein LOC118359177 [Oncorhynchus keta]